MQGGEKDKSRNAGKREKDKGKKDVEMWIR